MPSEIDVQVYFLFSVFRCAVASLYEVVSVGRSVGRSVGPSVRRSVRRSVGPVLFSKVKSTHTRRILCRVSGLVLCSLPSSDERMKIENGCKI